MYMEESILKFITLRKKMKMCYLDELVVKHKEGSSTGQIYGKGKKKRQFYYTWNIDGCTQLVNLMKKYRG